MIRNYLEKPCRAYQVCLSSQIKIETSSLCPVAIGSALSPDYSYSINTQDNLDHEREKAEMSRSYEPNPADTSKYVSSGRTMPEYDCLRSSVVLSPEFEEFVKAYAESVHDQWSYAKVS